MAWEVVVEPGLICMAQGGVKLTAKKVLLATETFKKLSPAQTAIDMNQIDIIMRKLGVHDPFLCHQVFSCFDTDGDRTVDFREFIWGLSMIYKAPLAGPCVHLTQPIRPLANN